MFTEYFERSDWHELMPGVRSCCFSQSRKEQEFPHKIPIQLHARTSEILFFTGGELMLHQKNGVPVPLGSRSILLLSDCSGLSGAEVHTPLSGICLSVNHALARDSLSHLCQVYGDPVFTMKDVDLLMRRMGGCFPIFSQPWSYTAFYALEGLSPEKHEQYCLIKTFELLYLLCTKHMGDSDHSSGEGNEHFLSAAAEMQMYMMHNLGQKITIEQLSRQFHLSPTSCKTCFRAYTGVSIHQWLLDKRMERAAGLLSCSTLPVLQIAQAVGYDGTSQFNVAFKKKYGVTPRQYRKSADSAKSASVPERITGKNLL